MKTYLIVICEQVDNLAYVLVEQLLNKIDKKVKISDNLFLISVNRDNLRIDEFCFAISKERKSNVFVVEVNKDSIFSWNLKDKKLNNKVIDFFDNK